MPVGKHSSFRFKAILILLSVSVLPILALFLFNFRVTGRIYSEQLKEEGRRETLKAADEFEGALNQMDSVLTSLIFSTYEDQSVLSCSDGVMTDNMVYSVGKTSDLKPVLYVDKNAVSQQLTIEGTVDGKYVTLSIDMAI